MERDHQYGRLLSPLQLGPLSLSSRIVMAPMTRSRAGNGDCATSLMATYYAQRASAGLIVAEASQISPQAQGYMRTPGIHTAEQIAGWRQVTDAVHKQGGTIFLQLWHVGRVSHPLNRLPGVPSVAPSALAPKTFVFTPEGLLLPPLPQELSQAGIAAVIDDYAAAARHALAAGFDGVEVHAGNGYLIDQFLQDGANRRSDDYGGTVENRCRLLFAICDRLAWELGPGRFGVRLTPFGTFNDISDSDPASLFGYAIAGLSRRALAYLHIVNVEATGDRTAKQSAGVDVVAFARQHYQGVLIAAGGYTPASAEALLQNDQADLVAFGRPFIANPDLVARARSGIELAMPDRATFYTEGPVGYTDYPSAT